MKVNIASGLQGAPASGRLPSSWTAGASWMPVEGSADVLEEGADAFGGCSEYAAEIASPI